MKMQATVTYRAQVMADGTMYTIELSPGQTYDFDAGVLEAIERDMPGALVEPAAPKPAATVAPAATRQVKGPAHDRGAGS